MDLSGDKALFSTGMLQIIKEYEKSTARINTKDMFGESLTLPTRVNTAIPIFRPEVSFGEYVISGFLFVVF